MNYFLEHLYMSILFEVTFEHCMLLELLIISTNEEQRRKESYEILETPIPIITFESYEH